MNARPMPSTFAVFGIGSSEVGPLRVPFFSRAPVRNVVTPAGVRVSSVACKGPSQPAGQDSDYREGGGHTPWAFSRADQINRAGGTRTAPLWGAA
jgi:hypothetical protein